MRRAKREETRDRLVVASLGRLSTPDPDTFRDDTRFSLDALPALTARADQIKQLRQTILNLAVRGKLVPQDPSDEPVSELLNAAAITTTTVCIVAVRQPDPSVVSAMAARDTENSVDRRRHDHLRQHQPRRLMSKQDGYSLLFISRRLRSDFRPRKR